MNSLHLSLFTVFLFPFYIIVRHIYFKLPIGPDCGFYVSNNTLINKKIDFNKGWNANYAACSKWITEYFYSLIYIVFGSNKYKYYSRFFFSIYNYITAIIIGLISYVMSNNDANAYLLGLTLYAMISSEPHYGIYFESGEQFEILFQSVGILLILIGFNHSNPIIISSGLFFWFLDAFLVKFSGLISAIVVFLGLLFMLHGSIVILALSGFISLLCYLSIISFSGKNIIDLLKPVFKHEVSYCKMGSQHKNLDEIFSLIISILRKTKQTILIMASNPVIPVLSIIGLTFASKHIHHDYLIVTIICALGLILKFYLSTTPIWYYNIPLLSLLAVFASLGSLFILKSEYGILLLIASFLVWASIIFVFQRNKNEEPLNRYVWKKQAIGVGVLAFELEAISAEIRGIVESNSLFVYGHTQQAYMLFNSSYDVTFLSAAFYVIEMAANFQHILHDNFYKNPPKFIFTMKKSCDFDALNKNLGLQYELVKSWYDNLYLYQLKGRIQLLKAETSFNSLIY